MPPELSVEARIAIDEFHLASELARRPEELSYGDRKVAAIVRAVAMPSKLLLLDEPTAGLDTVESSRLGVLVQEFASSRGVAVLLVEPRCRSGRFRLRSHTGPRLWPEDRGGDAR